MEDILRRLAEFGEPTLANLVRAIDILIVAYLIYRLLKLIRGTRAWRVMGGVVIFVIALFLSDFLQLRTLHWLLDKATLLAPVALVILLLPELRQTLEGFAKLGLWPERLRGSETETPAHTIEEIVAAVSEMASSRIGALIVVERAAQLDEIVANGVSLNAQVSAPLLNSIFFGGNPLHDGAVVIRGDRILAAACRLPLSENTRLEQTVHMRHRAGLGAAEAADCLAIIVSEERGTISVAIDGQLRRLAGHVELREVLQHELRGSDPPPEPRSRRKRTKVEVAR